MLLKRPGTSAAAVLSLALGIAAISTVFNLANAVLLRPLPVPEPDRLVSLYATTADGKRTGRFSFPAYEELRDGAPDVVDLAAHANVPVTLGIDAQSEPLLGDVVTGNFFAVVGVSPVAGRALARDDDRPAAEPVVVVSQRFSKRSLGGEAQAVGRTLSLNGDVFTVVGVVGDRFGGLSFGPPTDVWVPAAHAAGWFGPAWMADRARPQVRVTGRLVPDVTRERAAAALDAVASRTAGTGPEPRLGQRLEVVQASLVEGGRRTAAGMFFAILLAMAGLILLVACANVANLMLARGAGRRREVAIRLALGATRMRLVRQFLVESLLLALTGGVAGVVASLWTSGFVLLFNPLPAFEFAVNLDVDGRVLAFGIAVTVAAGLLVGLAPALQGSRRVPATALKDEAGALAGGVHQSRLRNTFVGAQVAISMVLLVGAGLMLRSLQNAQSADPGFAIANAFAMDFDLDLKALSREEGLRYYRTLLERVEALPGVRSAGLGNRAPLDISTPTVPIALDAGAPPAGRPELSVSFYRVDDGYFETTGIALVEGRGFDGRDVEGGARVVVVNETMARRFWPNASAVGQRFRYGDEGTPVEVVGVARDSKYRTLGEDPTPLVYSPFSQDYEAAMTLIVRTEGAPGPVMGAVRNELGRLDRSPQGFFARTMAEHTSVSLAPMRIASAFLAVVALVALLLASVGVYAVVAHAVGERTREIGIRMALGATAGAILKTVVARGMRPVVVGLVAGACAALALARFPQSMLFGVGATDPTTIAAVGVMLAAVSLVACYVPARRAARVDPTVALRSQ
jgi:predicted permease